MCLKSLKLVKQASQHSIWDIAGITKGCCLHCIPRHSFLSLDHVDPSDLMPCSLFHAANNRFLLLWPPLRMGWGPSCLARWLLGCCSGTEETSFCSSRLGQSCNFCFWFLVLLLLLVCVFSWARCRAVPVVVSVRPVAWNRRQCLTQLLGCTCVFLWWVEEDSPSEWCNSCFLL